MKKKKLEFSKSLLVQESVLIWIMTISFIILAFYCIGLGFMGSLPWLAAMVGCPWAAYAISQTYYYKKATVENQVGGLKYEATLAEINKKASECIDSIEFSHTIYEAATNPDDYQI